MIHSAMKHTANQRQGSMRWRTILSVSFVLLPAFTQTPALGHLTWQTRRNSSLAATRQNSGALAPGSLLEVEIVGGETLSYRFEVAAGQYARIGIDPRGAALKVRLVAADGKILFETFLPAGLDPERFSVVAATGGVYRVEVTGATKGKTLYAVGLEELRAAEEADQKIIEAERLSRAGRSALAGRTAASLMGALEKYRSALDIWKGLGNDRERAETLLAMGNISHNLSRPTDAFRYYGESLALWRSLRDRRKEAQTLSAIGWTYHNIEELEKALDYYNKALPIRRETNDVRGQAQTLTTIGQIYAAIGEPQKAIGYYNESLPLAREAGDKIQEAFALNNFALLYVQLDEYQKALDCLDRALPLWKETDNRYGEVDALTSKGMAYDRLGDFEKSIGYFELAIDMSRRLGYRTGESNALHSIGAAYWGLGQLQGSFDSVHKAIDYLIQALAIKRSIGQDKNAANVLNTLGLAYDSLGERDKALDYFKQALTIDPHRPWVVQNIGLNCYYRNEYDKAIEYCTQALQSFRERGDKTGEARALRVIALSQIHLGNLNEALSNSEAALAIVESGRSKLVDLDSRTSYRAVTADWYVLQIWALSLMHLKHPSAGYDIKALETTERARAQGLLDLLAEAHIDIHEGVETALVDQERMIESRINAKEQYRMRLASLKQTDTQRAAVERDIASLLAEYQEIRSTIRSVSPRYASLTQPSPLSAKEIQRLLDDNTIILDYWLNPGSSLLWLISSTSITTHVLADANNIDSATRRVYELLTARNQHPADEPPDQRAARIRKADVEYNEAAAALSEMLLGPVASQLGNKRLVFITESALRYIPFAALPAPLPANLRRQEGTGTGRTQILNPIPLIADHEIINLPSASVLGALRNEPAGRTAASGGVAIIADPVFSADDPRTKQPAGTAGNASSSREPDYRAKADAFLPSSASQSGVSMFRRLRFSREEADEIASLATHVKSLEAVDFAANKDAVTAGLLSQYGIVHFATHTLLNSRRPELSGIVLSLVDKNGNPQDGFLRLHEIYNLRLNASLVVLSACQTALGAQIRGEGLVGLTRGFMYAGAPRIVASLWSVDDRATAELMKRFYKGMLVDGLRPAAALRAAQIGLLAEKGWNAPYYWAAFTLQGDWK